MSVGEVCWAEVIIYKTSDLLYMARWTIIDLPLFHLLAFLFQGEFMIQRACLRAHMFVQVVVD